MKGINDALRAANALEDAGDLDAAIVVLSEAIESTPANAALHSSRGRVLYVREAYALAVEDFDIAISLRPTATALYMRARARCMLGDLDGALTDFANCLELQPGSADAHYETGLILEYRRDRERALASYQAALRLYENGEATSTSVTVDEIAERVASLRDGRA